MVASIARATRSFACLHWLSFSLVRRQMPSAARCIEEMARKARSQRLLGDVDSVVAVGCEGANSESEGVLPCAGGSSSDRSADSS